MNETQIHTASRTPNTDFLSSSSTSKNQKSNLNLPCALDFKLASSSTKRLTINFSRKRKSNQETSLEEIWKILAENIKKIQNDQDLTISCEKLYKYVESICKPENTEKIYTLLKAICEDHTKTLSLNVDSDSIHFEVNNLWKINCKKMEKIINIFAVLDRNYLLKHPKLPTLQDMSAELFKKHVILGPAGNSGLKDLLVQKILKEVQKERNGNVIDVGLIKNLIQMLSQLGLYESSFEEKFLMETNQLYEKESRTMKLDKTSSIRAYLKRVEKVYSQERLRVQTYLQLSTEKRLLEIIIRHFLERNLEEVLKKGMGELIVEYENAFTPDLTNLTLLYRLSSHYKEGHSKVAKSFGEYVREKGTKIVEKAPKDMIQLLLDFKDQMDEVVSKSFEDSQLFKNTLKEQCERFINSSGGEKPAQLIAAFIDTKMKSKQNKVIKTGEQDKDQEIEHVLNKVMVLFRCIQGKDTFEIYYKKDLAKRLINSKNQNVDAEKNMLSKLKHECGPQFTAHLEGMFRDIDTSREETENYLKSINEEAERQKCRAEFNILTKSNWPTEEKVDIKNLLPENLKSDLEGFEKWYIKNHEGRKLAWQGNLGTVIVTMKYGEVVHDIEIGPYQALVLMLFEDLNVNQLTFKEINQKLGQHEEESMTTDSNAQNKVVPGIPIEDLKNAVSSIIFAKPEQRVLQRKADQKDKGTTIDDDTVVQFNKGFKSKKMKFKIGYSETGLKVDKKGHKEMQKAIQEDRSFRIDAIIVRVMKTKKELTHNELMIAVKEEVKGAFELQIPVVKKRIENLISRDFLKRTDGDGEGYEYLA